MDLKQNVILIKGVIRTNQIAAINYEGGRYAVQFLNSDKTYHYSQSNVVWLINPAVIELNSVRVVVDGKTACHLKSLFKFSHGTNTYYTIEGENGAVRQYFGDDVEICTSCLDGRGKSLFDYFKQCAAVNKLGIETDDECTAAGILSSIYGNIDFVDNTTAAVYLNPNLGITKYKVETPIFPFGCNASQKQAVQAALANQISVIQGPPGTGKTQTILNIIANLVVRGKSVLVVSNNNAAIVNVKDKLDKKGFGFLVASLGKKENKEAFLANQPPLNPKLSSWRRTPMETNSAWSEVDNSLKCLDTLFEIHERLATARQELADVEIEKTHFANEHSVSCQIPRRVGSSNRILDVIDDLKHYADYCVDNVDGLWWQITKLWQRFSLWLRQRYVLKSNAELSTEKIHEIIIWAEWLYYCRRISELKKEIAVLENGLEELDAELLMKTLTDSSEKLFMAELFKRFNQGRKKIESAFELYCNGRAVLQDYPVVLSTTFSARSCFKDTIFDYVIMDEASQVSIETGLLALTCAKNAVIVGDTMQLPNVVSDEDAFKLDEIRKQADIADAYDACKHSFLSSILVAIPNVVETLLREHYRCHPDIINFCNQKFYGGNLLVMTQGHEGDKPLMAIKTSPGHHARGHYNQREIDAVKLEVLPQLDGLDDIGVIAPYNEQVKEFKRQMPEVEAATVHKYQGREKGTIIMSVTDDKITEFADNPNLLNVAVSRAKERFCLVVSGNQQNIKGNICDLLDYIQYRHGTVMESRLRSIYDYLFTQAQKHRQIQRISEYDSENITYALIERIRKSVPRLSHIKVLCHYPLRYLIRDTTGLSDRETAYARHAATHIDFLVINRVSKRPLLAIETDGYSFHREGSEQSKRDQMKNRILELYGIRLLRLSTIGHSEEQRIVDALLADAVI